ncbi:MAG: EscU/YscU/HrcU family type III secretion system export apparatus switch protein [Pseudomonadota bacterium]
MAEETDLSRTEPASAKRLQEARRAGDVPRSSELSAWLVLLAALGMLAWLAPRLVESLSALFRTALQNAAHPFAPVVTEAALAALWATLPLLAALFAAALVAPMLLSGWVYAPIVAQADFSRASPFKFLIRLFSAEAWFDAAMALLKLVLGVTAVTWALTDDRAAWQALGALPSLEAFPAAAGWVGQGLIALAGALALAAALDAGWRWWRYLRRHAMTWQEVLAEARESELGPEVRAQLRARQQQTGRGGRAGSRVNSLPEGEGINARPRPVDEVIG